METLKYYASNGFTLAEILLSLILLSIITIGSFKSFLVVESNTSSHFIRHQQQQITKQQITLNRLKLKFLKVSAQNHYPYLNCLIKASPNCN